MATLLPRGARIGEYILETFLGRGGFGEVWGAIHHEFPDRRVAIKVPTSPGAVATLRREGKVLATLDHPGIAKVHGIDLAADPPYCVIEWVEGGNLKERLEQDGPFDPKLAARVLRELLPILHYAHGRGVVHRDIKPENVLVTADGALKLTDFGFAHALTGVSIQLSTSLDPSVAGFAGTIAYVAPEVRDGEDDIDGRADLYSLGIVFFELLTGRRPAGPEVPSDLRETLPAWCDSFFRRLCARRERRFADASAALAALQSLQPPPIETAPPTGTLSSTLEILFPSIELLRAHKQGIDPDGPPPFPIGLDVSPDLAVEILAGPKVIELGVEAETTARTAEEGETRVIDRIGRISESQLSFLQRELEATSTTSRTFYIQSATVDWLDELGLDTELRGMLRKALAGAPGVDLHWRDPLDDEEADDFSVFAVS